MYGLEVEGVLDRAGNILHNPTGVGKAELKKRACEPTFLFVFISF